MAVNNTMSASIYNGLGVSTGATEQRPLTAADVLTAAEVAVILRVPRSTVEDWARRGVVPSRKVGRRRLYIRSRIEAMLLAENSEEDLPSDIPWELRSKSS